MTSSVPQVVPSVLRRLSSDEYRPLPWTDNDLRALALLADRLPANARRGALDLRAYAGQRRGTMAALQAINESAGERFYDIPPDAEMDAEAAGELGRGAAPVIDVQTHLAIPRRLSTATGEAIIEFLKVHDPELWANGVHPQLISAAEWVAQVFGNSETAVAVLTSGPGRPDENIVTNKEIAAVREIVDRYAGTGRVLNHTIVHPNIPGEIDLLDHWRDELHPSGWKIYTMWEPYDPAVDERDTGWYLDDEEVGLPFLERVQAVGPRVVAVHKGIYGLVPGTGPLASSPRDIGPAAKLFPDVTFLVYHSGYEPDVTGGQEGPWEEATRDRGVNRLVASLSDSGIPPGANVYAELGSTWFMMMRKPKEAAHVLGKLLAAVGPERILWGTDCVWYGSPQPLIDAFRAFVIPERMQAEFGYPPLTAEIKDRILSTNAAGPYGIDLDRAQQAVEQDSRTWLNLARNEALTELG
jgi:hypothetical protein